MRLVWYTIVHYVMCGVYGIAGFLLLLGFVAILASFGSPIASDVWQAHATQLLDSFPIFFLLGGVAWGSGSWFRYVFPRLEIENDVATVAASICAALLIGGASAGLVYAGGTLSGDATAERHLFPLFMLLSAGSIVFVWWGRFVFWMTDAMRWPGTAWTDRLFMTRDEIERYLQKSK